MLEETTMRQRIEGCIEIGEKLVICTKGSNKRAPRFLTFFGGLGRLVGMLFRRNAVETYIGLTDKRLVLIHAYRTDAQPESIELTQIKQIKYNHLFDDAELEISTESQTISFYFSGNPWASKASQMAKEFKKASIRFG